MNFLVFYLFCMMYIDTEYFSRDYVIHVVECTSPKAVYDTIKF